MCENDEVWSLEPSTYNHLRTIFITNYFKNNGYIIFFCPLVAYVWIIVAKFLYQWTVFLIHHYKLIHLFPSIHQSLLGFKNKSKHEFLFPRVECMGTGKQFLLFFKAAHKSDLKPQGT